ncbi:hypothetical protein [Helicobacter sp. T3_23-1056]
MPFFPLPYGFKSLLFPPPLRRGLGGGFLSSLRESAFHIVIASER